VAKLEDLEASVKTGEVVDEEFEGEEGSLEDLMHDDMLEAIDLFRKARAFLEVVSDKDLCKKVGDREREVMAWLASEISEFLDEKEGQYLQDVEFEEETKG
jgi:hypothetical protein